MLLPAEARPLVLALLPVSTHPMYTRFVLLTAAAFLTTGRPAGANVLPTVGDDTVDRHPEVKLCGKGRHRDPVRSWHAFTAWRYAYKWVVLAVLVKFPFAARRWALLALVDLYVPPDVRRAAGRGHRTPAQRMCRLIRVLRARFPDRTFVFAGDSGYGTHEVARFCHRHRRRLTLVSKLHPDANLFARPRRTPATAARGSRGLASRSPGRRPPP